MSQLPEPIERLITQFERLPGIGPKSAQRLAFFVTTMTQEHVQEFAQALLTIHQELMICESCCAISDRSPCNVCGDPLRDQRMICVVQDTRDMIAIERMKSYDGLYHVLGGAISPMDGIGPDQLHFRELLQRIVDEKVEEVILATNSSVEGEATALYIARLANSFGQLKVTRIAHGIPVGGDLEFADEMTLKRAMEYRRPM
ncbi:MAG: recombination mediator RecR [Acidibacillus sp.]|uniref:Recombination protein RecR n=1 Tax=Sulfoacidibacillus ferrooxidans TaxID=2005001 RepID=A0A9X1V6Y0_9BACL|nr:recombination mediator RecR [Sulfoacidibacillus ferrooxidans]MCI0182646.1 Recombination protein RecR [Sulfoacidibacillus ferrooxidans]MCY0894082.1 recombination mediator RecR [Acidibacillus sp.]